jgi:hypothetical protein
VRLVGSSTPAICPRGSVTRSAKTATAAYASGWIDEFVQAKPSGAEAAMLTDVGDKPLVVLTAGAETDATHDAAQTKLATLSTNSSHRVVEGASHPGVILDQHCAKVTTDAVLNVVASVRNAAPLAPDIAHEPDAPATLAEDGDSL